MKLKHYFPNYLLSVLLTFIIIGASCLVFAFGSVLDPQFYVRSAETHGVSRACADYARDYFEKSYGVSGIPAEIYMDGLDEKIIKQAVDGRIYAFFGYITGETESIADTEIDFTQLEQNISDFFDKFAEEKNVEVNDLFKSQLDKTIKAAEKDVSSFTNAYMLDYLDKSGLSKKLRSVYPLLRAALYVLPAAAVIIAVIMALLGGKSVLYWISVSGMCGSVIVLVPALIIKSTGYFNRLIMRTDFVYKAVTGALNDGVDALIKIQLAVLAASAVIMICFAAVSAVTGKKEGQE